MSGSEKKTLLDWTREVLRLKDRRASLRAILREIEADIKLAEKAIAIEVSEG